MSANEESNRKRFQISVLSLLIIATAFCGVAQVVHHDNAARDRLVGAWRLVSLEQQGTDGKIHQIDCCGLFVFTRDGHMSVQVMQRNMMQSNQEAAAHAGSEQYSRGGYEATYGRYEVDEGTHSFTIHVEGSLVPALIGKDLPRLYEFSGKQLIVKPYRPDEHWKVTWEHY